MFFRLVRLDRKSWLVVAPGQVKRAALGTCGDRQAINLKNMKSRARKIYRIGDRVRIMTGPFAAFTGKVEGINQFKSLLKVKVEIFGRPTPVKVPFSEAEKLEFERPLPPPSTPN